MPPAQAQAQAQAQVQPQLDKQIDKIEQQSKTQRKKLEQTATDPRLQDLKKDIEKTSGVKKVSEPLVNSGGTAAVLDVTPTTAPSDRATCRAGRAPARRHDPEGHERQGHDRRRRRDDGGLRRPRGGDQRAG